MKKTVLITGASAGFGKLIAKKFQAEDWNVIATMRSPEKETELTGLGNVLVNRLDVTDKESIANAVAEGVDKFGKIDVLVNNAGYGVFGPMEPATHDDIRRQFEVNVFGLMDVTRAVLPHMRNRAEGIVINFSSIGGRISFPYMSLYHATKYAIEGLTESLQYELNPMGIKMKLIEPGAFETDFAKRSMALVQVPEGDAYKPRFDAFLVGMQGMLGAGQDPQEVADMTFEAATDGTDKLRYVVGADAIQLTEVRTQVDDVTMKNIIAEQMGIA